MKRLKENKIDINKVLVKIISFTMILMMLLPFAEVTFAANNNQSDNYDFFNSAKTWFKGGETKVYLDENVLTQIAKAVEVIGTGVISIATVVLGIRYILGSATQKADVKDNLITLFVACIFFFGWSNLRTILIKGVEFSGVGVSKITGDASTVGLEKGTLEGTLGSIFSTVLLIGKAVALATTVYIGFKFVFAGAEGKSQLKEKGIMYIIGIILIFATLNVLSFISDIATQI